LYEGFISATQYSLMGVAAIIDVETTGLNPLTDEIVELAIMLIAFNRRSFDIEGIIDEYAGLREPQKKMGGRASQIHGITASMVAGRELDYSRIETMIGRAEFLIAHNAMFDRRFVTRLFPSAHRKKWLCSMHGINWAKKGFSSRSLQRLVEEHGIVIDEAHRGPADVRSCLALLSFRGHSGESYFRELIGSDRQLVARLGAKES